MSVNDNDVSEPWWRNGYVWLLLAGPAMVIVAGAVTVWVTLRNPDPLVADDYYRRGIEINKTLIQDRTMSPALQARNHAATPPAESVTKR